MGMKSGGGGGGGEIVQVQGGHIVRSTGRKDRHSKVYTAKGPRDRRVRLSAHTAIQFYDVQDRLGYDRPSKAVDWLIKKAKSSIDKLAELPPRQPPIAVEANEMAVAGDGAEETESSAGYNFHQLHQNQTDSSNFNIIADTMKSFFPTSSAAADNSSINFQNYPPHDDHDLISNPTTTTTTQDLGLSLHSFQDQGLNIHHHTHQPQGADQQIQTLFGATLGFDSSSYQRMVAWSNDNRGGGGGAFLFNSQPHHDHESFGQGGTLQSSFAPSASALGWNDHLQMASQRSQQQQQPMIHHDQSSSIFGTRFGGGLPVFCLPGVRMQGQEAENGLVSDQPSPTSPNSTHH